MHAASLGSHGTMAFATPNEGPRLLLERTLDCICHRAQLPFDRRLIHPDNRTWRHRYARNTAILPTACYTPSRPG
jgi:hypothetical protein